ncbi:histone-like nucleoid-structuring protein Lsr2 [Mycolicibacterium neworleansense]|uniref:histone-like nucleoid-structuring protein Lsr2 n=1 Tax=Mycolicibacterium neworleansense TaxID=146018 RepID=UPI0038995BB1
MAKKVTVTLVDDFDGEATADETVEFGLDGVTYEIDLSSKNATKLRNDLKQWVEAGRRVGGRRRGSSARRMPSRPSPRRSAAPAPV